MPSWLWDGKLAAVDVARGGQVEAVTPAEQILRVQH